MALPPDAARAGRNMTLQRTIQDGPIRWSDDASSLELEPTVLKPSTNG